MSRLGGSRRAAHGAPDAALFVLIAALSIGTVLVLVVPAVAPAIVNDRLDLTIVTAASLVAVAVAAIDWARGRVAADGGALLRGSAFAVLAVLNILTLLSLLLDWDFIIGASLEEPGQLPLWAGVIGRGTCAALLVLAGVPAARAAVARTRTAVVLLGPALAVSAGLVAAWSVRDALPALATPDVLARLAEEPTVVLPPGSAPFLVVVQAAIGIAFLGAAVLAHRSYVASGRGGEALMAAGLVVAAFSQVHAAIHPGAYASLTTTGDLLRLAFYGLLLAGIIVDRRDDLRALERANAELRRLAEADAARAALEERARLAREIHDGLSQDLWYAKLKQSRLAQLASLSGDAAELSREVEGALDAALAEARHAIAAMREGVTSGTLLEMLQRHVEDFSDRFALRAELHADGASPELGPRAEAEVLRIVQEAMTNARRHADATVVRVHVTAGDPYRITVTDNGRGFDPAATGVGFGLESMRQRAEIIGGTLRVSSGRGDGTRIELELPRRGHEEERA